MRMSDFVTGGAVFRPMSGLFRPYCATTSGESTSSEGDRQRAERHSVGHVWSSSDADTAKYCSGSTVCVGSEPEPVDLREPHGLHVESGQFGDLLAREDRFDRVPGAFALEAFAHGFVEAAAAV